MKTIVILIDGMTYASWIFLVAVGMTLVFGVMKVLNIAHGSLFAFGAYLAATFVTAWFAAGLPAAASFVALIAAAGVVAITLGLILERGLLRFLYSRDEVVILLATYAALLILEDVSQLIWGVEAYPATQPYGLLGSVAFGYAVFNNYELALVGLALVVGAGLWLSLTKTRAGKIVVAVIHDREIAQAMGINVERVYLWTFLLSAFLGALGGAVTAPMIAVAPGVGIDVVVQSFAVMVIGGLGSIPGAAIGAVIVGLSRAMAIHLYPAAELFAIYAAMVVVLVLRPQGLFQPAAARKI